MARSPSLPISVSQSYDSVLWFKSSGPLFVEFPSGFSDVHDGCSAFWGKLLQKWCCALPSTAHQETQDSNRHHGDITQEFLGKAGFSWIFSFEFPPVTISIGGGHILKQKWFAGASTHLSMCQRGHGASFPEQAVPFWAETQVRKFFFSTSLTPNPCLWRGLTWSQENSTKFLYILDPASS